VAIISYEFSNLQGLIFLQTPFLFDIEGEIAECRAKVHASVENFVPPGKHGEWQITLNKIVCSYLVKYLSLT